MLVVGCLATVDTAAAAAAPTRPAMSMNMVTGIKGMALKSIVDHGDGSMTAKWAAPAGEAVTVTGTPGATVSATQATTPTGGEEMYFEVTMPPIDKTDAAAVAAATAAFKTGKRSVLRDAANTGIATSEVASLAAASAPIYDSWCVDVKLDNEHKEHFCDVREKVQDNGGGDWYMGDEMSGSVQRTGYEWLYSSYGGVAYPSGNTMPKWAPTGELHPSACGENTAKVGYQGVELSSTTTICPDKIDPLTNNLGGSGLEEFWHGCDDGTIGLNPVDVIHSPPSASLSAKLKGYIHMEQYC
ncbi:MAG: hypothetical protein QOH97_517 [Actinoplanes sp.]|nr:hypothetical protein [Actinoplanes sp.]